jgi:hypothetical protein
MKSYKFRKIVFVDGFEIENGLLGLEQDIHLSVINFLIQQL